ncbi:MAG: hypothetical protein D6759_11830, partial [Chloroflexi bacterium]
MPTPQEELDELRRKLESLESLRDVLGDEAVARARAELESRIRALVETGGGAIVTGDVQTAGDFVGRDQVTITVGGQRAVVVGGDARGLIAVTGDGSRVIVAPDRVPPEALEAAYLRSLAQECRRLPLGVVDPRFLRTDLEAPVPLPEVYVDLKVVA